MFGAGGSVSVAAADVSGVQMILNVISLLTDRERVAADIREWAEAGKKLAIARAEHDQTAKLLSDREARVSQREQQVAAAESRAEELGLAAADKMAKAGQRMAEWSSLRAELRKVA
jgi:hypothetical protein